MQAYDSHVHHCSGDLSVPCRFKQKFCFIFAFTTYIGIYLTMFMVWAAGSCRSLGVGSLPESARFIPVLVD